MAVEKLAAGGIVKAAAGVETFGVYCRFEKPEDQILLSMKSNYPITYNSVT